MDNKEATERLEQAFHKWINSDDFRSIEKFIRVFHNYSFGNIILIFMQKQDATRVAGFNAWKKVNRFVKKGEKGIMVIAPCTYTYRKEGDDGVEQVMRGVKGFKPAYVFDISQTEGEPVPEEPEVVITDEYEGLQRIMESVENMGYTIEFYEESHGEHGYTNKKTKIIHVHNNEATGQQASTIVHEWAHLQVQGMDRAEEEIVVQTASYFIMARLGLDTSWYTAQYVQSWAQSKNWRDVSKLFSASDKLCKKFFDESEVLCGAGGVA